MRWVALVGAVVLVLWIVAPADTVGVIQNIVHGLRART